MITEENKVKLLSALTKVFPEQSPKTNNKAGGGVYAVTMVVDKINNLRLQGLTDIVADVNCRVELKRSGTGISIHFN